MSENQINPTNLTFRPENETVFINTSQKLTLNQRPALSRLWIRHINSQLPSETNIVIISHRMYHVMHIESSPESCRRKRHPSPDPRRPFLEPSPGETVQCLNRSILIHDTTFEQKKEHFYILLSRSKKKRREKTWRFSIVSSSAF